MRVTERTDFLASIDLVAAHVHESLCELRATRGRWLPLPRRALINAAIRGLETVQDHLHRLEEEPWEPQPPSKKPKQLNLL